MSSLPYLRALLELEPAIIYRSYYVTLMRRLRKVTLRFLLGVSICDTVNMENLLKFLFLLNIWF